MLEPFRFLSSLAAAATLAVLAASAPVRAETHVSLGAGAIPPDGGDAVFAGVAAAGSQNTGNALFIGRNRSSSSAPKSYGAAAYGSSQSASTVPDADIEKAIADALRANSHLQGEVAFSSNKGVVTLAGRVGSVGQIYRVIALVEQVPGVVGVNEEDLQVG